MTVRRKETSNSAESLFCRVVYFQVVKMVVDDSRQYDVGRRVGDH